MAIADRTYVFYGGSCRGASTRHQEILGGDLALLRLADEPVPPDQADRIVRALPS
jgi:hypothetical protein